MTWCELNDGSGKELKLMSLIGDCFVIWRRYKDEWINIYNEYVYLYV
jgi:hypothetical protein